MNNTFHDIASLASSCNNIGCSTEAGARAVAALADAACELQKQNRLLEACVAEWLEKTEWVQTTKQPGDLGLHRADVLARRIAALKQELKLEAHRTAEAVLSAKQMTEQHRMQCNTREINAAADTLNRLGYTYHGGAEWKPPIGPVPDFGLVAEANARTAAVREENEHLFSDNVKLCARVNSLARQVFELKHPVVVLPPARAGRVYVAGPMTGYAEHNFPAFNAKAKELRAAGWHVENPASHGVVEGASWADYLHLDIARLSTCCAIHMLPGWSKSRGAQLEAHIAFTLGMEFQYAEGAEHACH